ncbi:MAG: lipid-A-disaccharide synthase N-terminal domain-containing protein [Undibacterium sp.]
MFELLQTATKFVFDSLQNPWVVFGLFAQFVFFLRFVFQWIASEKAGRVMIPSIFWYLSIVGAIMIFIYSVYRQDIVFIFASFLSLFIYTRNIILHIRGKAKDEQREIVAQSGETI